MILNFCMCCEQYSCKHSNYYQKVSSVGGDMYTLIRPLTIFIEPSRVIMDQPPVCKPVTHVQV